MVIVVVVAVGLASVVIAVVVVVAVVVALAVVAAVALAVVVVIVVVVDRATGVLSSGVPWRAGPLENSNHSMSQILPLSQSTGQQRENTTLHMSMRDSAT